MKIIVAIDSFKGCLSSQEANQAATEGIKSVCPDAEVVQVPVSDGGEGYLSAFFAAISGSDGEAQLVKVMVNDPLMRLVKAQYLLTGKTAVIEMAQASGLILLSRKERNPRVATSYGVGQLVADAIRKGAEHIIVGLGGSATSDAGVGMLCALVDTFVKDQDCEHHQNFSDDRYLTFQNIVRLGLWENITELKSVRFTIASDVKNPLCGGNGAAHVFAPQKGATKEMTITLDEQARAFAVFSAEHFGFDRSNDAGAGAAGGLGYAFLQYLDADCKPGIELLLDTIKFDEIVRGADLVITGEGSADRQTLMGKLPMGVLRHSKDAPVSLIAGKITDREALLYAGFTHVECINPPGITLEEAMRKEVALRHIRKTVSRLINQS